ncbi:Uncharacterised protein [Chlamydia abortus]|nr:Uncharacterised protein [Chlamydia abortus]SGA30600.1 Uncharacterised protein [Chlamydia abortus]
MSSLSNIFSFTEYTTVLIPSPFAGAVINTFLAPASKCFDAPSSVVYLPVPSTTISTPNFFHGKSAGSFSANTGYDLPSTIIASSLNEISFSIFWCAVSYFSK